uniref:MYND-type domain-containing protein n=1 Tax=Angiostrongylus cantonensis TaxID=6313 RepID=A0A158PCH1_ANGCA
MISSNATNDLDLVLDRLPIDYPALVMETFLLIQSVYLPDELEKQNVLPLNKVIPFPTGTKLVGHACDERFCYVMTVSCGISAVRLLPKGFDDDLKDDKFFLDDLEDIKESISQDEKSLASLVSAFSSFAAKNIVAQTKVLISDQRSSRTGASILSEMTERVSVAIALCEWEVTREDRAEVMEQTTKRLGHISNVHYGYDAMVYCTLSAIHNLPAACADTMRELMIRAVDKAAKRRLVYLCADMLLTFANAIESCRRMPTSVVVPRGDVQWTAGSISDAYLVVCKVLLKELEASDLSQAERMRLRESAIRLVVFHLSECNEPIDGHELIVAFYELDECEVAVELAEKFKLFKMCLEFDESDRRAKLDEYKRRFAADEFDIGERADRYLLSCEEVRWRRELQNRQFEQIVYPDNPNRALTAAEMIELNMIDEDVTEGHKRALYLVACLLQDGDSVELRSQMTKIWISLLKYTEWNKTTNIYEVVDTPFGTILKRMEEDVTSMESLLYAIPNSDALIRECRKELSVNESATNWVRGAIERTAAAMRANLDAKKIETEAKKNIVLEIPETYFLATTIVKFILPLEKGYMEVKSDGWQPHHLCFAGDMVFITANINQAMRTLADFDNACGNNGLRLKLTKTMFMRHGLVSYGSFLVDVRK